MMPIQIKIIYLETLKILIIKQDLNLIIKYKKKNVLKNLHKFFEAREIILDDFESKIFLIKSEGSGLLNINQYKLKILILKEMLERLPIALAQVKADNNSENLLNEIRQIVYSLYQLKQMKWNGNME